MPLPCREPGIRQLAERNAGLCAGRTGACTLCTARFVWLGLVPGRVE
jgi:hypothetical protein